MTNSIEGLPSPEYPKSGQEFVSLGAEWLEHAGDYNPDKLRKRAADMGIPPFGPGRETPHLRSVPEVPQRHIPDGAIWNSELGRFIN